MLAPRRDTVRSEIDLEMAILQKKGLAPRFIYVDQYRFSRLLDEHDGEKLIRTVKPRQCVHQLHYSDIPVMRVTDERDHLEFLV